MRMSTGRFSLKGTACVSRAVLCADERTGLAGDSEWKRRRPRVDVRVMITQRGSLHDGTVLISSFASISKFLGLVAFRLQLNESN